MEAPVRQGTAASLVFLIEGYDLTDQSVYLTFSEDGKEIMTKESKDLRITFDGEKSTLRVRLTPEETLNFPVGSVQAQARWIGRDGDAPATNIEAFDVDPPMRIKFDIMRLIPRFLLRDHNGYALAKAIEAAFRYAAEATENGLEIILYVDKMPEWRLDEMAGELGCLYDYTAEIETKRQWIKNAVPYYQVYGTPQAIINYLEGFYISAKVEEFWEYNGDPFHFRVIVEDYSYHGDTTAWAEKVIENVKNVRSVLDSLEIRVRTANLNVHIGAAASAWINVIIKQAN